MPRWQLRYAVACAAIAGWAIAYSLAAWLKWPRLFYDPLDRAWSWQTKHQTPIPIDYWGLVLWGAGGAAVAVTLTFAAAAAWRRPLPRPALGLLGAWALSAFAYGGTYFMWTLWPF